MSREPFKRCPDCGTVKWPVRGLGRVCPRCDALGAWPVIMASYRPGPRVVEQRPEVIADLTAWLVETVNVCHYCQRVIVYEDGVWIDPEATGDDAIWRETCPDHDTFTAEHEPEEVPYLRETSGSARTRVETPDSELQRDVDRIISGTPYDWEQEGDAR